MVNSLAPADRTAPTIAPLTAETRPSSETNPKPDRAGDIPGLTGIRGILALWVVMYHFWPDVLALFPSCSVLTPMIGKGHFAVPAFFMLSGVVLAHNYRHLGRTLEHRSVIGFLVKRLARIYPVHFVSLMIVLSMVVVSRSRGWSIAESGYTPRDFVLNLFLVHTWVPHFTLNWNYPSWSISSEWFAYLLFIPLMFLCYRITVHTVWVVLVISIGCTFAIYYSPKDTWFRELLCVVPTFTWGAMFVYGWNARDNLGIASAVGTTARQMTLISVLLIVSSCFLPSPYYAGCLLLSLGVLVMSLYVAGSQPDGVYVFAAVQFLGEVSYSLYMTHTLAQKILYQLVPVGNYVDSTWFGKLIVLMAYVSLVVALTLVMYYLVERPARNLTRSLSKRA